MAFSQPKQWRCLGCELFMPQELVLTCDECGYVNNTCVGCFKKHPHLTTCYSCASLLHVTAVTHPVDPRYSRSSSPASGPQSTLARCRPGGLAPFRIPFLSSQKNNSRSVLIYPSPF